ncbi:MAG TPA: cation-translocating P-type ATPase [Candidatus Acidoferrum sp.]|nr:cation-translocating P-type ATPase [Candidatus Acidoferrum sp.]
MPTEQTLAAPPKADMPSGAVTRFTINGMTCGNCARHVTEAIQGVPGVRSAAVNLEANQATVRWAAGAAPDTSAVIHSVEEAGYGAGVVEAEAVDAGRQTLAGWQLNLWLGALITTLLMAGEWLLDLNSFRWFGWLSFALAGVVQVFAGARFYRGAWTQLKAGRSNMDTLVALGSTTAFAYSTWALFSGWGGHLYFMEAAAIITLISIGHWMESRVSVRASSALRRLLDLAPQLARRRNPDGTETEVPASQLNPGDLAALRPGDRVPTDGEVVEGHSAMDEAMLTGESMPVDKAPGSPLYAGTVNVNGRLVMRVTATGEATALAHIIAAVQRAQSSRARIQRLGDRVSDVFVPVIVAVALAAGLWWGLAPASAARVHAWLANFLWTGHVPATPLAAGTIIAAAVLIIACPCAMGLATPAAIMAGSNAAAQRGILIRDGVALEKAGHVTAVVFDKTGTLTVGTAQVAEVWRGPKGADLHAQPRAEEAVELAAALGRHSTHPISQAVARLASDAVEVRNWEEVRGSGVQGTRAVVSGVNELPGAVPEGRRPSLLRLGSLRWLENSGVDLSPGRTFIETWAAQGATLVGLAEGDSLAALFAVRDALKPGAAAVVRQLQAQGLSTYLLTGDNALTARSIAATVGIPPGSIFAEVRPEQKADFVRKLQGEGRRVAFVGDGINDAPALEQADLGVAVSRASDVAREAADIILLRSEIEAVPEALGLARATLRTIKQNLFWAFFYNAIGVPLAALGFMSPILCAAAMAASDLLVIGNALRLRSWSRPGPS